MADKRKPCVVILLRIQGKDKTNKIEFFHSHLWIEEYKRHGLYRAKTGGRYRLRVNGKWFNNKGKIIFYTKTEAKNLIFRSIKIK